MSRLSRATAVTRYIENVRRYNQLGVNGLKDKRHQHPGSQPLLSLVEQAQLLQTLQTPPADGGLWNSRKVAEWISHLLERPVSVQRGWDYLRSLEFRLRIPRPEHDLADPDVQETWKKNSER
jgi:transposase